jgi:hypothetical protein
VIERRRRPGELDGLQWYCERCQGLLYQEFFPLTNIETAVSARVQPFLRQFDAAHLQALSRRHGAAGAGGRRAWHAMSAPQWARLDIDGVPLLADLAAGLSLARVMDFREPQLRCFGAPAAASQRR